MRLHHVPTSPYARVVRVFIIETGLEARVDLVETTLRDPAMPLFAINPTGRVPTLETDDGVPLCETRIVCEYLDALHGGAPLIGGSGAAGEARSQFEAFATGFMDGAAVWARELRKGPSCHAPIVEWERTRATHCVDWFDDAARAPLLARPVSYGQIMLGCALAYVGMRLPDFDWRGSRARLAEWFDAFAARPSMKRGIKNIDIVPK